MFTITCKYIFLENLHKQSLKKPSDVDDNYWSARPGDSPLRQLEQLFAVVLVEYADVFEAIDIYTRLRNDQYASLEIMLSNQPKYVGQIVYFMKILIDQTLTRLRDKPLSKQQLEQAVSLCETIKKFQKSVQFLNNGKKLEK